MDTLEQSSLQANMFVKKYGDVYFALIFLCVAFPFKDCDSNFEVILSFIKVATNETTTLHLTICTWLALENYNNNNQ